MLLNLKYPVVNTVGELVNLVFAYCFCFVIIFVPMFLCTFIYVRHQSMANKEFSEKYGFIYEDLKDERTAVLIIASSFIR